MRKIVVIGGGASGMLAAYSASISGKRVILLEKNEKLGKKIYITGKGRCNLCNDLPTYEFFNFVVSNPKFLYSALNSFSPQDTISFFENLGLKLKTERGNRVFPFSDKASDVTKTLEKALLKNNVDIKLNCCAENVISKDNKVIGVKLSDGNIIECDSVIVCTGGVSYPLTGSTGDGYRIAKNFGHNICELRSALVGIELKGNDYVEMQGVALKNVSLTANLGGKKVFSEFGEMLFTHFGVSGPIVLSCSSVINRMDINNIDLFIDLKPALNFETLENRLIREFKDNNIKELATVMRSLLPKALISVVLRQAGVKQTKKCSELTTSERTNIINSLKSLKFAAKKLRPIDEAIVTAGGVSVKEVHPKTMESKIVNGLFFAGEVLDVDAFTGGFNLQIAFSTGYAAGLNA